MGSSPFWLMRLLGYNDDMRTWYMLLFFSLLGRHKKLVNLDQKKFDAFCIKNSENKRLIMLSLVGNSRGLNLQDLSSIKRLPNLQELYLEDAITQSNLEQIADCTSLRALRIEHAGKLNNVLPLARLTNLEALTVTIPIGWGAKIKIIPDISPLQNLKNLEYLDLAGIKIEKHGLGPLRKLTRLKKILVISDYWDERDDLRR
jgi:hypothetical protein